MTASTRRDEIDAAPAILILRQAHRSKTHFKAWRVAGWRSL
jgi:hypothetical protein